MIHTWLRIIPAAILILLAGCGSSNFSPVSTTEFYLGTTCTVTLYEPSPDETVRKVFSRIGEIHDRMTLGSDSSELVAVNRAAGDHPVRVSEDTFEVVREGLAYSGLSGGAFDITIAPLVKLWGIGSDNARVPEPGEIASVLPLVDYRDVSLDESGRSIFLSRSGMGIDLGAIAKGYAADEAVRILKEAGVGSAIVDFGGNIYTVGEKPDGSLWRIGIQNPFGSRGTYAGILKIPSRAVVTSGIYERFFIENDVRFHHILDTATGYPVDNPIASVSIVTGIAMDADALSTTVFSLGIEEGYRLVESLPDTEAIFITKDRKVITTPGIGDRLSITDDSFSMARLGD